VKKFADEYGLSVEGVHPEQRRVVLSGTVKQMCDAFKVTLKKFEYDGGTYRGRTGAVHVPLELKDIVHAVMGLDDRPQARPHFRARRRGGVVAARAEAGYSPKELANLYGFPPGNGAGQCIAIIELGGGYNESDLNEYFSRQNVSPAPEVISIPVNGGKNNPTGDPNGDDGEVLLDIEVAGAIANGAKIAVYFAPNTDAGFLSAITAAIHDTTNKPSVISISWGSFEDAWTEQARNVFDGTFQAAAAMGINVTVAAGDDGSTDRGPGNKDHVDFPASSPHVLACGGTTLRASGGQITEEVVWNEMSNGEGATGGGVSLYFKAPAWQKGLKAKTKTGEVALKMRGVPDVGGDADPVTGYKVRVDGTDAVIGGTSAVAPLWAALIAILNGANSKGNIGFIPPMLYSDPSVLRDITSGNNGGFFAAPGYDCCTGIGTPNGVKLSGLSQQRKRMYFEDIDTSKPKPAVT
jgi:kumamolisin